MKKIVLLLLSCFLYIGLKKENVTMVFNDGNNEYSMYILEFPNLNISTNNIQKIFENIKIIWIEPYVNLLYKDKLNYKKYYFEEISLKENINKFIKYYKNLLNNNNYNIDAINIDITGLKIIKMQVYCKEQDIINLNIDGLKYIQK